MRRRPVLEPLESRRLLSVNVAEFPIQGEGGDPLGIASGAGSDKNVWFTLSSNNIGMINPSDTAAGVTQYRIPTDNSGDGPIAAGPDGNYWFFEETAGQFGVINPSNGLITEIPLLSISNPQVNGLAAGPNGYLWFTVTSPSQIGEINTANDQITLFPTKTPEAGPYGIVEGPDGNMWFTEAGANQIGMINPTTHAMHEYAIDSSGTDSAEGITVGPDHNLWLTLEGADEIAVMSPATGALLHEYPVTTGAGPNSIALGPDGNLWFTESKTQNVATITTAGTVTPFATNSNSGDPYGITSGSDGNLWFILTKPATDNPVQQRIWSISPSSHAVKWYPYTTASIDNANGIASASNGDLWFTQELDNQVGELDPTTGITTEFVSPTSDSEPLGVAVGADGNVYYTEYDGSKIGVVNPSNGTVADYATPTANSTPYGIVADPLDGDLWFTEYRGNNIGRIDPATKAIDDDFPIPTAGSEPEAITVNPSGNVWFTEWEADQIGVLNPTTGKIHEYPVAYKPEGIVADSSGNIWVSELNFATYIDEYNSNGAQINQYTLPGAHKAYGLTLGPDGDIWFTDSSGNIGTLTSSGTFAFYPTTEAVPVGITTSPDGNIWFTGTGAAGYPNVIGVVTLSSTSNPTKLAVATQPPGSVTSGDGFGMVVAVENSAGDPDIDFTGTVTIALENNPGGDTLKGTLTATVNKGVAIFSGLTLEVPDSGYTIEATASGLSSTTTSGFNVTLGASQLVVTTQPPNSVQAGTTFGITVTAEDGVGNLDTSYDSAITLTLGNANGATLGGVVVVGANDGVATFTGLSLNLPANDYVILASSGKLTSATTDGFDVTSGPGYQLAVAQGGEPPSSVIAGHTFALTIDALDQNGFLATSFDGSVTLAISNNSNVSLSGDVTGNASDGVITFPDLAIDTAGSFTIAATSNGLLTGTTSVINVTAGPATQLVVAPGNPPGTLAAGALFGFVVDAEDQYDNIDPTFGATVAIALVNSPGVTLHGSPTATAQRGIATFSSLSIDTAGTYIIEATSGSLTPVPTSSISITPAAPFQLVFSTRPSQTVTAGQVFTPSPVIDEEDQFGNLETTDNSTVITAAPSAGTAQLEGASATVSGGIATFNNLTDTEAQTMMLEFSGGSLPALTSSSIDVTPGPAVDLIVKRPPTGIVAGIGFPLEVDAQDTYGNLATSYSGLVTLSVASGQGSLTGSVSAMAVNGVANFTSVTCDTSGSISIGASATSNGNTISSPPSGSAPVVVNPGAANHFVVTTTFPDPDVAGTVGTVTVTAEDQNNNVVGSGPNQYVGTVDLGITDVQAAGLPFTYTFTTGDAGSFTFTGVTLKTAGSSQTITATDSVNTTTSGQVVVDVVPAQVNDFVVTTSFANQDVGGTSGTVTVTAEDLYQNVVGNGPNLYLGTVNLAGTDAQASGLPASETFTAGDAGSFTFTGVTLKTAGSQTITATDSQNRAITGQLAISVVPAQVHDLVVTTDFASTDIAGTTGTVTVTAQDQYHNTVGSGPNQYLGTVDLDDTDPQASGLPSSYTFTAGDAGSHTFTSAILKTAGSQTITATDSHTSSITSQVAVNVVPGQVHNFVVTTNFPNTDVAGTAGTVTITAEDLYHNTVGSGPNLYLGTVNLDTTDAQAAGLPASHTYAAADAGSFTFMGVTLKTAGSQTITAADSQNSAITGQAAVAVVPSQVHDFVVTTNFPNSDVAGTVGTVTITAEDVYHNPVGSGPNQYLGTVDLNCTDPKTAGLPASQTFTPSDAGTYTFTGVSLQTAGNQTITATDSQSTVITGQVAVDVVPGQVHDFVVTTSFQGSEKAGTVDTVTVTAQDQYHNTVGSGPNQYLGTVDLSSTDAQASGLPASQTFSAGDDGSYTFTGVILKTAGSQTISATDSVNSSISGSCQVNVTALAADQLVFTTPPPSSILALQAFTIVVSAEDQYHNVDPTFHGNVSISLADDPGLALTVQATGGVATFTGLTVSTASQGNSVKASAAGLPSASTPPVKVKPSGSTPTVKAEQVVPMYKLNKKGKPQGNPIAWEFELQYSAPMTVATAGAKSNYQIDATTTKKGKTTLTPVAFAETYNRSNNTVTLTVSGKNPFANGGGRITIVASGPNGVSSQGGVLLSSAYTSFTIMKGATGIGLG